MTDKILIDRAVVEQALEALFMYKPMVTGVTFQHGFDAMRALRAALEQPQVEQEPCGHMRWKNGSAEYVSSKHFDVPLDEEWHLVYTHPQPPRQSLTDQVIQELADEGVFHANVFEIVRRIEEEHGIFKLHFNNIGEQQ